MLVVIACQLWLVRSCGVVGKHETLDSYVLASPLHFDSSPEV